MIAAAALALALVRLYGTRRGVRPCLAAAAVAFVLLLAATASLLAYGSAADPGAAVVWRAGILRSIPTEADVDQKTEPLSAGNVASVNKAFLGWVRVSFENGETGWVRAGEVVPLWGRNGQAR